MRTSTAENAAMKAKLLQLFQQASVGEIVEFDMMTRAIGAPIKDYAYLAHAAMKDLNKNNGALFENVRGVGYKRLETDLAHTVGIRSRRRIKAIAKTTQKKLVNAASRANDLSPEAARKINRELAVNGMIEMLTGDGFAKNVEAESSADRLAPVSTARATRTFLEMIGAESRRPE